MALKIRLARMGATHNPIYRVVVTESASRRDGRFVEVLGTYSPRSKDVPLNLKLDRIEYWLSKGALPSDTMKALYKKTKRTASAAPAAAQS